MNSKDVSITDIYSLLLTFKVHLVMMSLPARKLVFDIYLRQKTWYICLQPFYYFLETNLKYLSFLYTKLLQ